MFEAFLKRQSTHKIVLELKCSPAEAQEIIANAIDTPWKFPLFPSYLEGPDFQGKVRDRHFDIFLKTPRRGAPPATLKGQIVPNGSTSKVIASIMRYPAERYFEHSIKKLVILGVVAAISFVLALIGLLKQSAWQAIPFALFFLSMGYLILSWHYSTACEEAERLERFITTLFNEVTIEKNLTP